MKGSAAGARLSVVMESNIVVLISATSRPLYVTV
jgi:hypothetical protein